MRKDRLFRALIVVDFFLSIFTIAAEAAFMWTLPGPLRDYVHRTYFDWSVPGVFLFFAGVAVIGATIIAWVGLFLYWWPARVIYVGAWGAWVLLMAVSGPSVMTAPGNAIHLAEAVIGGMLIGMMYFTPEVSEKFDEAELEPAAA